MTRKTFVRIEKWILALVAVMFVAGCAGIGGPFVAVFTVAYLLLVTGWGFFLARVVPRIVVDWQSFGLAAGCLLGLVVGLHFFCGWLHREIVGKKSPVDVAPDPDDLVVPAWRLRTTLCLVGIVVLMFVAGTAVVGGVHQFAWLATRR